MEKKFIIVGGVAGGATCAARLRRLDENATIIMVERGNDVSFANCGLPYFIGQEIVERDELLVQTKQGLEERFRLDVRIRTEALSIDRTAKKILLKDLSNGREYHESYDKLILSPGASPIAPPIPGADHPSVMSLRDMGDMDRIKAVVDKEAKSALIVGAGFIGLEMAENLTRRGLTVHVVDLAPQVMAPFDPEMAAILQNELIANGVQLHLKESVVSFADDGGLVRSNLAGGDMLKTNLVILAIGVRPDSKLAKTGGLKLTPTGAILVNDRMQTSDPDIFAVGDAVQITHRILGSPVSIPLAGPANRQARIAADNAAGRNAHYRGALGTSILRVFGLTAAVTGANEKSLQQKDIPHEKVYVHRAHHVTYFPGARQVSIKLLFAPGDGRILGAQVVGAEGVDKRIDVLATALHAGLTVHDLTELELAYAPPFGAAKDPINIVGYVACNALNGDERFVAPDALDEKRHHILDVREPEEYNCGHLPASQNIPLGQLRERIPLIPRDKPLAILCGVGQRAYYASRILSQNGFESLNVMGGMTSCRHFSAASDPLAVNAALRCAAEPRCNCTAHATDSGGGDSGSSSATDSGGGDSGSSSATVQLDVRGLQCPGPLAKLAQKVAGSTPGTRLQVTASDSGFAEDVKAFCAHGGHELISVTSKDGFIVAELCLGEHKDSRAAKAPTAQKTMVVFSGDLDRVLAAFILANAAVDMGDKVTLFFTFWGLNALRRNEPPQQRKHLIDRMFGMMMPRGAAQLKLSQMNMAGMGTALMKKVMRDKHVPSLPELIASAQEKGVKIVACSMSMDVMGLTLEELLPGIAVGGAASFLAEASLSNATLFI